MPIAKSIIEIDVDDARFQAFLDLFQKYQDALKRLPGDWGRLDSGVGKTAGAYGEMTAALLAQSELIHRIERGERGLARTTAGLGRGWHGLAGEAGRVARSVGETTRLLFRWGSLTGIFGGLLGLGGLYGLDRLAASASATRGRAAGLGVSPSALQSFEVNLGQFVNVPGALGATIQAQQDITKKRWMFTAMGIPAAAGMTPNEALIAEMQRARQVYQTTPAAMRQNMLQTYGFLNIFSMDEIRRLAAMSPQEFAKRIGRARQEAGTGYGLIPGSLKAFQDFDRQLNRAGLQIEDAFIAGLAPLAPQLKNLSAAITGIITDFAAQGGFKAIVGGLNHGLKSLDDYIKSPQFKRDVKNFETAVGVLAGAALHSARGLLQAVEIIRTSLYLLNPKLPEPAPDKRREWEEMMKKKYGYIPGDWKSFVRKSPDAAARAAARHAFGFPEPSGAGPLKPGEPLPPPLPSAPPPLPMRKPTPPGPQGSIAVPYGTPQPGDPHGLVPLIRADARKYGINPDIAVAVARSEGLAHYVGDHGTSFGAFQLHIHGGLGDEFRKETGLNPADPKNEPAMIDWTLAHLRRTGWGPYHGAARAGIAKWEGIGSKLAAALKGSRSAAAAVPLPQPKPTPPGPPARTPNVTITVQNQTGGSATISASQVAV